MQKSKNNRSHHSYMRAYVNGVSSNDPITQFATASRRKINTASILSKRATLVERFCEEDEIGSWEVFDAYNYEEADMKIAELEKDGGIFLISISDGRGDYIPMKVISKGQSYRAA